MKITLSALFALALLASPTLAGDAAKASLPPPRPPAQPDGNAEVKMPYAALTHLVNKAFLNGQTQCYTMIAPANNAELQAALEDAMRQATPKPPAKEP